MHDRTLNGRYRLDEVIGEGGMAVVYRGYDLVLNRVVAIKILRDQYATDANFLRRFEREAQSAARLTHPRIASIYDVGQDGPTRYIVMEMVDGPSLKDLIRRQGPFSVEGAAFVVRQVAEALDHAHANGLVHRDIKPQNILVDHNGNVKVVDFGIAKGLRDANLTEAGTGMGTVHYVSPEQARGEPATPSSDVYATGIVLYEMLTKRLPFEADTPVGVAMQHVTTDPPPPSEFNPTIPPQVEDIVLRALAKDPADRFQTAGDLAAALDHWDQGPGQASQATRVMAARGAPPPSRGHRRAPGAGRGGRGTPPPPVRRRDEVFRDDVGCVTWLIGSAILIGLIGLVVLAFKLGDFSPFDPPGSRPTATATATVEAVVSPTTEPSPSPSPSPSPTGTPSPSPSPTESPTPSPSPTPETALVPHLLNSTVEQARAAASNFNLITEEVFSDTVPRGQIVSQEPRAGTEHPKGDDIFVTVSQGPEFIALGHLRGLPRDEVRRQLDALPLTIIEEEEASASVPVGSVVRTEPAAQVRSGGTVTLFISVGDQVLVPDVFGTPYQQAVQELEAAGLTVGTVSAQGCSFIRSQDRTFNCQTFPNGGVVSGTLQWNTWVPRGSSIAIAYYDASAQ